MSRRTVLFYIVASMPMDTHSQKTHSLGNAASLAVIIMTGSNIISRALGFGRMIVLADTAGMQGVMDAYSFSFLLPDILNHILAGSALSITFIPFFQDLFSTRSEEEAWRFFSNILTTGTILFILFISLSMLYTKELITLCAGGNITGDPALLALTVRLTRIILPAQLFFFWGALLNGVQYAKKRFLFPALSPLLYNIGIITGGIFLFPRIGIDGFSWGVLAGAFAGNVAVQIPGALAVGMKYRFRICLTDRRLIRWFLVTVPFILGLAITFSHELLFRTFGSFSADGPGAIAGLDYSYKAMMFLVGIFGQSFAAGIYPFVSQLAVEKQFERMNALVLGAVLKIASIVVPVSLIAVALSDNVIGLLYQRGAFTPADTLRTARVFSLYLPGAFFMCGGLVITRVYYAMKNTVLPLVISTASVVACLPLYYRLGGAYGAAGIAGATSLTLAITFFTLLIVWKTAYKTGPILPFVRTLLLIFLFSGVGFFVCLVSRSLARPVVEALPSAFLKNILLLAASFTPALLSAGLLLEVFGISAWRAPLFALLRRFGKK